eukprot:3341084-Rhodomonas_salina.1
MVRSFPSTERHVFYHELSELPNGKLRFEFDILGPGWTRLHRTAGATTVTITLNVSNRAPCVPEGAWPLACDSRLQPSLGFPRMEAFGARPLVVMHMLRWFDAQVNQPPSRAHHRAAHLAAPGLRYGATLLGAIGGVS